MATFGHQHATSGLALYAVFRDTEGCVWNGSAFVVQNNANWTNYAVALTESPAGGCWYQAAMPALPAGSYSGTVHRRVGATAAPTDPVVAKMLPFDWDGSAEITVASRAPAATALSKAQWTDARAGYLDIHVSSRLASGDYALPDNAGIAAIRTQTNKLSFTGTDVRATLDGETAALSPEERNALADAVLTRNVAYVQDAAGVDSLCYVVLAASHASTMEYPNTLTVFKTDGTREFARKTLRTNPSAEAITGIR